MSAECTPSAPMTPTSSATSTLPTRRRPRRCSAACRACERDPPPLPEVCTVSKIRQLRVRPLQSCDLAFPAAGVLMKQYPAATLGTEIKTPFDLEAFYAMLTADAGDPATGALKFDAA